MRIPSDMPRATRGGRRFRRGRVVAVVVLAALVVLALSLTAIATFWTDYLWFDDLQLSSVWTALLSAKVSLAVVATIGFFVILWANLTVAEKLGPTTGTLGLDDEVLERYQMMVAGRQRLLIFVVSLAVALIPGISAAGEWKTWLLFRSGGTFGVTDPQFGWDIGFFVFKLPFLSLVIDWVFGFLLVTLLLVCALYYLNGSIRFQSRGDRITGSAKAHLSVILALMALVKAGDYWLQRFELTLQRGDSFDGAGYTAVNATLPALQLLILVALFAAGLFVWNIRRRGWVLPVIAIALWMITSVVLAGIYPAFVQRFQVQPAELNKEQPYIKRNIEATRTALGIADVETHEFEFDPNLTAKEIQAQRANLDLARLLDPTSLGSQPGGDPGTLQALQFGRPYYQFRDIDVDRYMVDQAAATGGEVTDEQARSGALAETAPLGEAPEGEDVPTPVIISTRELDLDGIAPPRTWEKEHLVFTHGYAGALAPADEVNDRGEPRFLMGDIPVSTRGIPELERPELYVGEDMTGYAIVGTKQTELTQDNLEADYAGSTGVEIDSFFRKAAFSLRFGEIDPLISDLITDESEVIYKRDIVDRVKSIAPYLLLDPDPYPVLIDGGVSYVVDGYTTTANYPYAEAFFSTDLDPEATGEEFNYVRNSVKAVVDAYDGTVTLYLSDTLYGEKDPIIRAYAEAFPDLFVEDIPAGLRDHLRYPELLFKIQTEAWGRYHQDGTSSFFNNSDEWDIAQAPPSNGSAQATAAATDPTADGEAGPQLSRIDPFFQMLQLSPDREAEFLLTRPFVLESGDDSARNLTAIMVASNDPDSYGQLEELVIQASESEGSRATTNRVDGTLQAAERIATYQPVSEYQTLVGSNGSTVEFGNLLILPFGNSLLYLRPVYARQETSGINTLQRVAVTSGGVVGFGETIADAMADLMDGDDSRAVNQPASGLGDDDTGSKDGDTGSGDAGSGDAGSGDTGSGDDGSGEPGSGDPGSGDAGSGDEPSGGDDESVENTPEALLAEADRLFTEADEALRAGELGRYQDLVAQARSRMEEAVAALGGSGSGDGAASTTTTTTPTTTSTTVVGET